MKWFNAASTNTDSIECIEELIVALEKEPLNPDLICMFISSDHVQNAESIAKRINESFPDTCLIGASGSGVIGNHVEIENTSAISIVAAELPDVDLRAISFSREQLRIMGPHEWRTLIDLEIEQQPCFIVLCDPYGFDPAHVIRHLNLAYGDAPIVGGVASGAKGAGESALICGAKILNEGALVLGLYGDIQMTPFLSQGCRPIGPIMTVTGLRRNMIESLNGKPAVDQLQDIIEELPSNVANHFRHNPMIGIAEPQEGKAANSYDFKIRSVLGVSKNLSGMAIGGYVEKGDSVQFHIRDPKSASKKLHHSLKEYAGYGIKPEGAFLFSCIGRGSVFFGEPNHDSQAFHSHFPNSISGGLFCNGEIGAAKSKVQVHGYSCSIAMFSKRMWS